MVAIYSTFLQRGYDQLIHDVALQNLPVMFAIDRAGLVGGDGATHQGSFDLSFLRCIPNMVVMAPADENECRQMLYTAHDARAPGGGALSARPRARRRRRSTTMQRAADRARPSAARGPQRAGASSRSARMVAPAERIAERLDATLVNMRFIKPLDEELVRTPGRASCGVRHHRRKRRRRRRRRAVGELLAARGIQHATAAPRNSGPIHRARFAR